LETGIVRVYAEDPPRDWTYAPDVGRALVALLAAPRLNDALYNVASGQVRSPIAIAEALANALPVVRVAVADGTDPALPPLTRFGVLRNDRLLRDTGFKDWTPFEAGVAATAHWAQARLEMAR
jgi:nucleoside-diphosphate-sugar epimerase